MLELLRQHKLYTKISKWRGNSVRPALLGKVFVPPSVMDLQKIYRFQPTCEAGEIFCAKIGSTLPERPKTQGRTLWENAEEYAKSANLRMTIPSIPILPTGHITYNTPKLYKPANG